MYRNPWSLAAALGGAMFLASPAPGEIHFNAEESCVTQGVECGRRIEGRLEVDISEDFERGRVQYVYFLNDRGRRFQLLFDGAPPPPTPGVRVVVRGEQGQGRIVVQSLALVSTGDVQKEQVNPALGEQRTLVTLVNFLNDPSEPYSTEEIDGLLIDESNPSSMASYIREASYGRAWISGEVRGWLAMPYEDAACGLWTVAGTERLVEELDPVIDWSPIDRWIIIIPQNANCGFSGYSSLGKIIFVTDDGTVEMSRLIMNGASLYPSFVAAHEIGHSMASLQHARDYECGEVVIEHECNPEGLGSMTDRYDIMGHVWYGGHYGAPNKEQLGWLMDDVVDVSPPGGNFTLLPFESGDAGTKVLRIPAEYVADDLFGSTHYYISYRMPMGFDAIFKELRKDGAMIHIDSRKFLDGQYGRSRLLDMSPHLDSNASSQIADSENVLLSVGESYQDAEKGVSISVTGASGAALDVSVTIERYCGNGIAEPILGEDCDAADLNGESCGSLGHAEGILGCDAACTFDISKCGLPRCAGGHRYNPDGTCTTRILSDAADGNLWRSRSTWAEARASALATMSHNDPRIYLLVRRRADGFTWIYRDSIPFDTSGLPEGRPIVSADLSLKVLGNPSIVNSHPASADQLVLVHASLENPPGFVLDDYDQFGALDNPVEGAARIDVSDTVQQDGISVFRLNQEGLGWINTQGWTTLGIRTGYDVDDIYLPGEQTELNLSFRSSDSPVYGPELSVTYPALPRPPGGTAGRVPDGSAVPGIPLAVTRPPTGDITLNWDQSCLTGDSDYEIYEGRLGDFGSHAPIFCSTGGETSKTFRPSSGNTYYLVVPRSADREGSYGTASDGIQRAPGGPACLAQETAACD